MAPGGQREPKEPKESKTQGSAGAIRTRGSFVYRREFKHNIENMMYAFGDVEKPDEKAVEVMEDMTITFLTDLIHRARPNPQKLPIPFNQNIISNIATSVAAEDEKFTAADSISSSTSNRRTAASSKNCNKDSKAVSSALSSTSQMPPRLAAHPYVGRPRLTVEDLKFACRKDAKLTTRIEELVYLEKVIAAAKKAFDNPEEGLAVEEQQ